MVNKLVILPTKLSIISRTTVKLHKKIEDNKIEERLTKINQSKK